jgi:EmrB/QacA subfamily drug resistance transporter
MGPLGRLRYEYVVAAVFVSALFMEIMDATIVNVALETISSDFGVPLSSVEWLVTAYLLSLAVWIPASGWIGDRFGTKRTILFALAVFTAASAACGLAESLPQLIAFRVLQGVGGGMLTPVGTAMLFRAFPPERRARASTVLIIPTVLAPASGPIIGGLLIEQLSWRWIFFVNVPIGLAALVFGAVALREERQPDPGSFDGGGFVLSAIGLASLLFAISEGPLYGWGSPRVVGAGTLGVAALAAFVAWELRRDQPMLHLRLLGERMFRLANIVGFFVYGSFIALLFLLALFLQQARMLSPLEAGLTIFPEAIGVVVASQIVGRLYPYIGPRRLLTGGLLALTAVMVALTTFDATTSLWTIRGLVFCAGASFACSLVPLQVATFAGISAADTGQASAMFSTQRQVAAALGVALLATVLTSQAHARGGELAVLSSDDRFASFRWAFLTAALLALLGALAATRIRDEDARATMRQPVTPVGDGATPLG